jgi:hypothetical protein
MIVIGPLRVTLENFNSMFAPVLVRWLFCEELWPLPADWYSQLRKHAARAKPYSVA